MLPRKKNDDNKDKPTSSRMVAEAEAQPNAPFASTNIVTEREDQQHQKVSDEAAKSSSVDIVNVKRGKTTGQNEKEQDTPPAVGFAATAAVATARTTNTATPNVDPIQQEDTMSTNQKFPFPWKLHTLLDDAEIEGYQDIVSWDANGTSFRVHKPIEFCASILGRYFRQSKYESFTRQLYIYGFSKVETKGPSQEAFSHPQFRRDNKDLSLLLLRNQVRDRRRKRPQSAIINTTATTTTSAAASTTTTAEPTSSAIPFLAGLTPRQQHQQELLLPFHLSSSSTSSTQQFRSSLATTMEQLASSQMLLPQQQQQQQQGSTTTSSSSTWEAMVGGSATWQPPSQLQQQQQQQQQQHLHLQQQQRQPLPFQPLSRQFPSLPQGQNNNNPPLHEQRHSQQQQQQILPSPPLQQLLHQQQQPPTLLSLPPFSHDDMSPIVSNRLLLQQRTQPQEDFPPIPNSSCLPLILDDETRSMKMSQTKSPSSSSSSLARQQEVNLGAAQQLQQQQPLSGGDSGDVHGNEFKNSNVPQSSPLPPSLASLSSYGMVNWGATTTTISATATSLPTSGTSGGVSNKESQQPQSQDDSRWDDDFEPRSIEEMIARPLQRQRRQRQQHDDVGDNVDDEEE